MRCGQGSAAAILAPMSTLPLPLGDESDSNRDRSTTLTVRVRARRTAGKKEQAVNRLLRKVESCRAELERERRRLDEALVFHGAHVAPRARRATALRTDVVRGLVPFLDERRLKKAERAALRAMLIEQLDALVSEDPSPADDIRDLFERLHDVDFDQVAQEQAEDLRAGLESMFEEMGLDVELPEFRPGMTDEEAAVAAAGMADALREAEEARSRRAAASRTRPSKRQLREEERERRAEEMRKVSLGAVYRRLAKALHPDRERDAAVRDRKSAIMQEVTAAYAARDLHALLRIEVEWTTEDPSEAAMLADETLDAYAHVLKQQVAELQAEFAGLAYHPRYQPLMVAGAPFALASDLPADVRRLDMLIDSLSNHLSRMASGDRLAEVRDALRVRREVTRARRSTSRW